MKYLQEEQEWMDKVQESLDGLQSAHAPDEMFGKIQQRIKTRIVPVVVWYQVSMAAACLLLLIAANIYIIKNNLPQPKGSQDPIEGIIDYYGWSDNAGF